MKKRQREPFVWPGPNDRWPVRTPPPAPPPTGAVIVTIPPGRGQTHSAYHMMRAAGVVIATGHWKWRHHGRIVGSTYVYRRVLRHNDERRLRNVFALYNAWDRDRRPPRLAALQRALKGLPAPLRRSVVYALTTCSDDYNEVLP